jgi:hypothetical protein
MTRAKYYWVHCKTSILGSLALLASCGAAERLFAQATTAALPNFWRADGPVNAIVIATNTAYIGGDFTYVGPASGSVGLADATAGTPLAGFPALVGTVLTIVSDGAGGWYAGGQFTSADDSSLQNLVHVLANKTIDSAFKPNPDSTVHALAFTQGILLAGGEFFQIAGASVGNLALLDPSTGETNGTRIRVQGTVNAMAVDGDTVYLGGSFNSITTFNGAQQVSNTRSRAAAINPVTATLLDWNPGCTGGSGVNALAVNGTTVYLGGDFTQCGGKPRNAIASVNNTDGTAGSWNPNAQSSSGFGTTINAIAVVGNVLYAGGTFTTIGARTRTSLAALQATGFGQAITAWQADANGAVYTILPTGTDLLVGGTFTSIGGTIDNTVSPPLQTGGKSRGSFARIAQADGAVSDWGPQVSSLKPAQQGTATAYASAIQGNSLVLAGDFISFGGVTRQRLAAISLDTGAATDWNPGADLTVKALALGRALYVGGSFTNIGGASRPRLAEIDMVTGQATSWDPQFGGGQFVSAIAFSGRSVFVGGTFQKFGGKQRSNLAELETSTGNATDWDPEPGGSISSLLWNAGQIYVGGNFFGISGGQKQYLALLTTNTVPGNQVIPGFDAKLDGQVRSMSLDDGGFTLFIGGDFTSVSGQGRKAVAAIDPSTGKEPNPWDAQISGQGQVQVRAVLPLGQAVYVGGQFSGAGGENRGRVGSVHPAFGAASGWDPGADGPIDAIAHSDKLVIIGGEFSRLGLHGANPNPNTSGQPVPYLAAFNGLPAILPLQQATAGKYTFNITDGDGLGSSLLFQATDSLTKPNWTTLQTLDILGIQDPIQDTPPAGSPSRYYRLQRTP